MAKPQKNSADSAGAVPPAAGTAAPLPAAGELLTISRLARELGVPADHIERLQSTRCGAGEDFVDVDGAAVFTPFGAEKIRALVAGEMRDTPPPVAPRADPAPAPTAAATPRREDLRLTRVFPWSCNLLAVLPNDNEVVLTVRSNRHLEPGMVLRACIEGPMGWTYEGRLPRIVGERQLYHPATAAAQPNSRQGKK